MPVTCESSQHPVLEVNNPVVGLLVVVVRVYKATFNTPVPLTVGTARDSACRRALGIFICKVTVPETPMMVYSYTWLAVKLPHGTAAPLIYRSKVELSVSRLEP
jgi:hypothetical protein